jgi:hypothetical protein
MQKLAFFIVTAVKTSYVTIKIQLLKVLDVQVIFWIEIRRKDPTLLLDRRHLPRSMGDLTVKVFKNCRFS